MGVVFIGFVLVVGWHYVDYFYRDYRYKGEWARRTSLVVNGLGASSDLLEHLSRHLAALPSLPLHPERDGFHTREPFGFQRLTEMVAQRATSAGPIYDRCYRQVGLFLVGFGVLTAGIFYFVSAHHLISPVFLLGYLGAGSAVIFPEAFRLWLSYGRAAKTVTDIHLNRISHLQATKYHPAAVLLLIEDYTSAVENAPMFLPWSI